MKKKFLFLPVALLASVVVFGAIGTSFADDDYRYRGERERYDDDDRYRGRYDDDDRYRGRNERYDDDDDHYRGRGYRNDYFYDRAEYLRDEYYRDQRERFNDRFYGGYGFRGGYYCR